METKICCNCKQKKPATTLYFGKKKSTDDGFRKECKECRNQRLQNHWDNSHTFLKCMDCTKYLLPEMFDNNNKNSHRDFKDRRCKSCKAKSAKARKEQRYNQDPLYRIIVERISGAKERAKKKNIYCDITVDDVQFLWKKQEGKCALSGLPMTYEMGRGRTPTNISIDKIDPNKGYTLSNIQLVCMAVNQMKSDLKTNELLMFCEAIAGNARKWNNGGK